MRRDIEITIRGNILFGFLDLPQGEAHGLIIFAHGSGSSRWSSRNQFVANVLVRAGFATLLFDLMTEEEDQIYENRFDIPLLASRLTEVTEWSMKQDELRGLPIGYFGASTGA